MDVRRAYPDLFGPTEAVLIDTMMGPPQDVRARHRIARANVRLTTAVFLDTGFAGRYRSDRSGRRQLQSLHIGGDFVDLPSYVLGHLDHDIDAVSPVSQRMIPHDRLDRLHVEAPHLLHKLWRVSLLDAAIHRYWIFRVGCLLGRARVASFFCEMMVRQYARGLCQLDRFDLPLTQSDIGEACGMTSVHANRMIVELREEGICTVGGGTVTVTDLDGLFRTGQYTWDYLFLPAHVDAALRSRLVAGAPRSVAGAVRA